MQDGYIYVLHEPAKININEEIKMEEFGKEEIVSLIQKHYDLRRSDSEKIAEKIINFIEEKCLEWNNISCQWEIK